MEKSERCLMKNLKRARKRAGLTQEELGKVVNVQKSAVSKYERGEIQPSQDVLIKMADILGCSIDYLLGRVMNPHLAIMEDLPEELKGEGIKSLVVLKEAIETGLTAEEIEYALTLAYKMKKREK
jgi:transcriptional regulator with XRE-family HTH domain